MVDLWNTTGPARDRNGTAYVEELFTENTLGILDNHDPDEPLFLFHSFHLLHTPLQVPAVWEQKFRFLTNSAQRKYAAMTNYLDDVMGKIANKLRVKGMWENTLIVVSSDNGGPTYNLPTIGSGAANNRPLRGGKMSDWEGGVRVNAFVSGGYIPAEKRGSKSRELIHMSDWYTTFCSLAGVEHFDQRAARAGLPPIDGIDQSALLVGKGTVGKRTEIHHSARALTKNNWKLIMGGLTPLEITHRDNYSDVQNFGDDIIPYDDYMTGYDAPLELLRNVKNCSAGCLYDVISDPTEFTNVATEFPSVVKDLKARLLVLNKGIFHKYRGISDRRGCSKWHGFYGPFVEATAHVSSNPAQILV
eukprot:TRINITY_DN75573_c0_g1_i1.p1 TRINITY_DN75573_c0_g1~~TRINITY_DN75573_c0_g1_i1.p1  ORF type:complete len:393 (-),score=29.47 TRINITY_DN75573_c0_g1_i1:293-1372(-)